MAARWILVACVILAAAYGSRDKILEDAHESPPGAKLDIGVEQRAYPV